MIICLDKRQQDGPLGISVLPYRNDIEECDGLTITEIVKGGRIDRDGRFSIGDRIVEVNDQTLLDVNFETAQSLISEALKEDKLKLNIVKDKKLKKDLQQIDLQQFNDNQQITKSNQFDPTNERLLDNHHLLKNDNNNQNINNINNSEHNLSNSFNEASPDDYTTDTFKRNGILNASNTRKMGKKYHIRLIKNINGLGFSITTRDNQIGQCPIYIKTILPVGAAKKDGNLKSGDRLIEVNGVEMTGKSHEEALKVLRDIETGQQVDLIVSRQENDKKDKQTDFDHTSNQSSFNRTLSINKKDKQIELNNDINSSATKFKLPRQLPNDNLISNHLDLSKTREVLSFNIPLNDTSSAGLGFSVKGKMSASSSSKKTTDLGIFVKKIFHGGAAFKDGRLKENDQLISINGISLLNSSNAEAMETLKRSLYNDGLHLSNSINLVVARVSDPLENPNNSLLSNNNYSKDETLYDTLGNVGNICAPINNNRLIDNFHQRNLSTISTDSMKINFYEQNYQTEESDDFNFRDNHHENNELLNLNRKSNLYNNILTNDGLSTDSNGFTISTPVKTSMKSDFTGDNNQLNDLSFNKFNNSNRQDVLIENDQENNDPNIHRDYFNNNGHQNDQLDNSLNKSKDSQMMNLSNVTNRLSLNDDEEFNFNFQRDGFGRQSMSEKRYAQLDSAKNTDTYKRAKQRKLQEQNNQINNKSCKLKDKSNLTLNNTLVKNINNDNDFNNLTTNTASERQSKRSLSKFQTNCCCFNDQQTYSISSRSSCPYHSQQTSPKTEQTTTSIQNDYLFNLTNMNNLKSTTLPNNQTTATLNYDNQFSPTNQFNLQPTPFTLAAQQSNQLNKPTFLNRQSVNYQAPINYYSNDMMCNGKLGPQFGQWLGMKKSSSLESLQTMMHEAKKENINYNTNQPYNTLRRPNKVQRNRNTNESFRTAIDKTYAEYMDNLTMETVNEEFSESGRFSITPSLLLKNNSTNQPTLTKSLTTNENLNNQQQHTTNYQSKPSSTSLGTQLSNGANEISDEEIGLIRRKSTGSKKKSGILRTLFRFGSRGSKKFKDKQHQTGQTTNTNKLSNSQQQQQQQSVKKELEEEVEKIRARKAALYEQELIQEYCNRLKDQQKFQQIINQQMQQRQQLNPQSINGNQFNNTLQKQSLQQQQIKKQQQNLRNLYVMDNDPNNFNQQQLYTNHLPQSNIHSNQIIINKQQQQQFNNFDTTTPNYLQIEYGLQNRSNGLDPNKIDNHLPKSTSYPIGYDILNNQQNGYFNGYYNNDRKPFTNNHLPNTQYQKNLKDNNSIQQFETVHRPLNSYDLKDAMQRPGSRVGVKIDEDLNQYVIVVRKNQNELNRPYV